MRDIDVRTALLRNLRAAHACEADTLILDELGLEHGDVRVDVAVINGELHGYELKSERDTLERLPRQVTAYCAVLDKATLVVGQKHLAKALELVPSWWGVLTATMGDDATVRVEVQRVSQANPGQNALSVAKLLWRSEALKLLEEAGAATGFRSKPRAILYERLTECLPLDLLRERVRLALKTRDGWRASAQQT